MVTARVSRRPVRWEPPTADSPYESRKLEPEQLAEVKLGLIHNPHSGRNVRHPQALALYRDLLGSRALIRQTDQLSGLAAVVREFREEGVDVIVVDGGDGSLQATVTEAYFRYGELELPAFVPLRGGSYNAVASNLGLLQRRAELLGSLRDAARGGAALRERQLGTIRVHDPRLPRDVLGFILMAGIPYKLNRYIHSLGRGTRKELALFGLARLLIGGALGTPFGKHIFSDTPARVSVDGEDCGCDGFKMTIATTLHEHLPVLRPCPAPLAASQRRFSYLVNFMSTREMFKRPYKLLMNRYHGDAKHLTGHARTLILHGYGSGYALDGERMEGGSSDIRIASGPPLRIWLPRSAGLSR